MASQRTGTSTKPKPRRRKIPDSERHKLWLAAGGLCSFCKRDLTTGALTALEMPLGEAAHIVGQQPTAKSPRGVNSLPVAERDKAENLILACGGCHLEVDHKLATGLLTTEKLRMIKREHEVSIRHLLSMVAQQRTVIVRMLGRVRGNEVELIRETAVAAVIRSGNRVPEFPPSYAGHGVEIDLRNLAGESEGTPAYYDAARAIIDEVISTKLSDGVAKDRVQHLSIFAFARLPLLVYLGSKLDDTVPTDLYQRHRTGELWAWGDEGEIAEFATSLVSGKADGPEAVLVANVSGTIQLDELPPEIRNLPIYRLELVTGTAGTDTLRRRESLVHFTTSVRVFFSSLERSAKGVRKLHVFGALPLTAGVSLGRAHDPHVHPTLIIYDRSENGYHAALEIS